MPKYFYISNEYPERNISRWRNYSYDRNRSNRRQYLTIDRANVLSDYDVLQPTTDDLTVYEDDQRYYFPSVISGTYDDDEYIEELPVRSPRRHVYFSPRRPQVIKRTFYESPPTPETVQYIYEEDDPRSDEEIIEYILPDRPSRLRLIEESPTIYIESLPVLSPRRFKVKEFIPRTKIITEPPKRARVQNTNQRKHLSLSEVLAQNRARRGTRLPKPRREVSEQQFRDPPTYNRHLIKNDFFVHK